MKLLFVFAAVSLSSSNTFAADWLCLASGQAYHGIFTSWGEGNPSKAVAIETALRQCRGSAHNCQITHCELDRYIGGIDTEKSWEQ
jgi:hypothetical protein